MKDQGRRRPGWRAILAFWCVAGLASQALASDPPTPPTAKATSQGRVTGQASPGSRIRLYLDPPAKTGSRFTWVQTEGPTISIEGQTGPELKVTVPPGASELGFLLVVSNDQGLKTIPFNIPVIDHPVEAILTSAPEPLTGPKADAGDDTIGLVGRRVTLNGSESSPREGLSYRWIQVEGPQTVTLEESGRFCAFVPAAPGPYRFALVVAHQNQISPADFVTVAVGSLPGPTPASAPTPLTISGFGNPVVAPPMMPTGPASPPLTPLDLAVGQALANLDDAPMLAGPLADVFQAVSLRMELYRTYGEIFSELSRRLEAVVPADPVRRQRWNTVLFEPMSAQTIASLLPLGLDLRVPGSQDSPLTPAQKQELRGLFDRLARRLSPARNSR